MSFFFFLGPSCQRFFDAVTVEGLSLLIVQGLLWLLTADQCLPRKTSFGTFTQ